MTHTKLSATSNLAYMEALFTTAATNASAALSRWTNSQISICIENLRELELAQITEEKIISDELLTMVVHELDGDLGGQLILTFDDVNGKELAAMLLKREASSEAGWSELEKSALNETGNIFSCSYMKTISDLIGQNLVPTPPYFVQDYGASILQQAVLAQAADSDCVMVCQTTFLWANRVLNWQSFFVPTKKLLDKLVEAIKSNA